MRSRSARGASAAGPAGHAADGVGCDPAVQRDRQTDAGVGGDPLRRLHGVAQCVASHRGAGLQCGRQRGDVRLRAGEYLDKSSALEWRWCQRAASTLPPPITTFTSGRNSPRQPLLTWLRANDPRSDNALGHLLRILSGGGLNPAELAALAPAKAAQRRSGDHRPCWYGMWVDTDPDPDTGVAATANWLSALDSEEASHTAQLFITALTAGSGARRERAGVWRSRRGRLTATSGMLATWASADAHHSPRRGRIDGQLVGTARTSQGESSALRTPRCRRPEICGGSLDANRRGCGCDSVAGRLLDAKG